MKLETLIPCFVCRKPQSRAFEYDMQPSEATRFDTYGHYGSTFWDSFHGEQLSLIVCDECLSKHPDRLVRHKRFRNVRSVGFTVGREWLDREPVLYFEGPEDDDDIEIEPEEIGVLTGYKIEWVIDWESTKKYALAEAARLDKERESDG